MAPPQIVAAVPTGEEVELTCADGGCSAEFSTICLQQSRTPPSRDTAYGLHGPERAAIAFTGTRRDGSEVALAPELLRFDSFRGHSAFKFSVPSALLKKRGLTRLTVKVERLAMLPPVPEAGDPKPQTAAKIICISETVLTPKNDAETTLTPHTKLIGAFAWEQISDILGKIEKTVHSGAIFPVQP